MKNREILFKGKRVDNGQWIQGLIGIGFSDATYVMDSCTYASHLPIGGDAIGRFYKVHPDTVCQLVKDDLFEGDVLRSINHYEGGNPYYNYHIIQWSEKFNGWFAKNKDNLGQEDTNGDIQIWVYLKNTEFEKTGNIHD